MSNNVGVPRFKRSPNYHFDAKYSRVLTPEAIKGYQARPFIPYPFQMLRRALPLFSYHIRIRRGPRSKDKRLYTFKAMVAQIRIDTTSQVPTSNQHPYFIRQLFNLAPKFLTRRFSSRRRYFAAHVCYPNLPASVLWGSYAPDRGQCPRGISRLQSDPGDKRRGVRTSRCGWAGIERIWN